MFKSLTARAILASFVWIAVALGIGGWAIVELFRDSTTRQFDANLEAHLNLLSAALASSFSDPQARMTHPDFSRVYSGAYWQVTSGSDLVFRSRSLWDTELPIFEPGQGGSDRTLDTTGPDAQQIRMSYRVLELPDGNDVIAAVALEVSGLKAEIYDFGTKLGLFTLFLGVLLLIAALILLRAAFAPLKTLQKAVIDRHRHHSRELAGNYPQELAQLVEDLNSLLARNERLRDKGRVQAANLAHALKTPAAILRNELGKARRGELIDLSLADQAVENVSAAADRHLSLVTAAPEDLATPSFSDPGQVAEEVASAMRRVFPDIKIAIHAGDGISIPLARSETIELLGNLIENAAKWARSEVSIQVSSTERSVQICVEDNGDGVAPSSRADIVKQGVRLDTTGGGSGLGLTIVADILERHGGEMELQEAALGGLRVKLILPLATD